MTKEKIAITRKVVLVGDDSCGKSSILHRFAAHGTFRDDVLPTWGVDWRIAQLRGCAMRPRSDIPAVERQSLLWRPAKTSVHFVLARLMRRRSGQNGRTRKDRARATMSLDFAGAHHAGRNRYQE